METPSLYEVDAWWIWVPVVIDKRAVRWWDHMDSPRQADFLENIDPAYFVYLAGVHEVQLDSDDAMHAALALRVTYSHAIESLFALIGASIQAPHCPAGWLLQYGNWELRTVVRALCEWQPVLNAHERTIQNWGDVAQTLFIPLEAEDQAIELREASERLWYSLAHAFLKDGFEEEYNSIKHGFRNRVGGSSFSLRLKDVPGVEAPPDRPGLFRSSEYGSSYLRAEKIDKLQWRFQDGRNNWHPREFAKLIPLIAKSMHNILAYLRLQHGADPNGIRITYFDRDMVNEAFSDPDAAASGWQFTPRTFVDTSIFPTTTPEEIMRVYLGKADEEESDNQP